MVRIHCKVTPITPTGSINMQVLNSMRLLGGLFGAAAVVVTITVMCLLLKTTQTRHTIQVRMLVLICRHRIAAQDQVLIMIQLENIHQFRPQPLITQRLAPLTIVQRQHTHHLQAVCCVILGIQQCQMPRVLTTSFLSQRMSIIQPYMDQFRLAPKLTCKELNIQMMLQRVGYHSFI